MLPWVLHELPAGGRERLLTLPGGKALGAAWRMLLRPRFERRQRRTFRYIAG